ncbi:MAG: type II/IV secretion system protein [Acidimicrobiia bacterium]|nr:type II/IV secretion system protein [Acidimicrobiia bacterium]
MNDTRTCPHCGASNWATAVTCHGCGNAPVSSAPVSSTPGPAPVAEAAATTSAPEAAAESWVRDTWARLTAHTTGDDAGSDAGSAGGGYTSCPACAALNWPTSAVCHHCGGRLDGGVSQPVGPVQPEMGPAEPEMPAGVEGAGPVAFAPAAPPRHDPHSAHGQIDDPTSSAVRVTRPDPSEIPTDEDETRTRPTAVDAGTMQRHLDAHDFARRHTGYAEPERSPLRLGDILVEDGIISGEELAAALQEQYSGPVRRRLGEVLIAMGFASEEHVTVALARRLGVPYVDLDSKPIDTSLLRIVPMDLCVRLTAVAYEVGDNGEIHLAMADPTDVVAADDLAVLTGRKVAVSAALPSAVERTLHRLSGDSLIEFDTAENEDDRARTLVDTLLSDAVRRKASDLHIEPKSDRMLIRARIDGRLRPLLTTDDGVHQPIVNRLKILSDLDISMRRLPQDGKVSLVVDGRRVHARVSTMPATNGEKVVLRISDESTGITDLDMCGFQPGELDAFREAISMSKGLVLMAGPTGSGKTTTLYAALNEVARPELNVITLEDPVERDLDVATQVQINERTGLTFPTALRSVLRQDPDVVMVGEIRDLETANITLRASLSGHLVFSTVHTNDAPSTVTRLVEMGIEPYLVGSAVSLVVAQRLVRRLCPQCAEPAPAPREQAAEFGIRLPQLGQWRTAKGCPSCLSSGYWGRIGLYEILPLTESIRDILRPGVGDAEVFRIGREEGLTTLWEQGLRATSQGTTTLTEVGRTLRGTRIPAELAAADAGDDPADT